MLSENHVIDAVCDHLVGGGYVIKSRAYTTFRGHDIHATKPGEADLLVEAKGEGSNNRKSNRFGKIFTKNQVNDHVGRALIRAFHNKAKRFDSAIAFPDNSDHRNEVIPILSLLKMAGLRVFLVSSALRVREL